MSFVCDTFFLFSVLSVSSCNDAIYTSYSCCPPLPMLTGNYCRRHPTQGNSTNNCEGNDVVVTENNSVVLVGYTDGRFGNHSRGEGDFAAVKLDSDGHELWRWQASTNAAGTMSVPRVI